ncbi:MAG: bifunctional glutamate N-acetyltransferase/amino-acid acetyltransferase ArgJ [Thermodesulfovibrionia bacterium]|nr:bifunctional glutamate N-acetyltransferase/amino-acid acetyltransferase ArgJ [Thermodesulfovibrionia bacterium]
MRKPSVNKKLLVPGFMFSGISVGIKKKTNKPDLGIIFSEKPANIAGVFTTNKVKAAPVKLDIKRIRSGKGQAIIINSGNANACTGETGLKDASEMTRLTAKELGIRNNLVYVSSTGIIGIPLPMAKIRKAIPDAVKMLSPLSLDRISLAIMTTDTFPKVVSKKIRIGSKVGTIAGIAKGSGMISPNMATMLSYIVTDIDITPKALDYALKAAVKQSFNRLVVDNDMSTNDTVMIMANGMLGNIPITRKSSDYKVFEDALIELTYNLAKMIAIDGEGATKLIEVKVKGAKTEEDAEDIARAIASSMLVKTAIYGQDPNWGRIISAIGYAGVDINENKIEIYINKCKIVSNGIRNSKTKISRNLFANKEINITVNIGLGKRCASILTCDLTEKYIKINAEYST